MFIDQFTVSFAVTDPNAVSPLLMVLSKLVEVIVGAVVSITVTPVFVIAVELLASSVAVIVYV